MPRTTSEDRRSHHLNRRASSSGERSNNSSSMRASGMNFLRIPQQQSNTKSSLRKDQQHQDKVTPVSNQKIAMIPAKMTMKMRKSGQKAANESVSSATPRIALKPSESSF